MTSGDIVPPVAEAVHIRADDTGLFMRRPSLDDLPVLPLPSGDYVLRTAGPEDATALATLLTRAFTEEWTIQRVKESLLEAPDVQAVYVIVYGGVLVATASARITDHFPGSGYLHWVGADPSHQGKGLGAARMPGCVGRLSRAWIGRRRVGDQRFPSTRRAQLLAHGLCARVSQRRRAATLVTAIPTDHTLRMARHGPDQG